MGQSGITSMLPNPGGSIGDQVLWAITLGLSWAASAIMWLMQIAQQILYEIEIAISPVFVACLMVPALAHLAKRFFMILVGICLWPLAWAVCDLATKVLIDLAVNPSSNAGPGLSQFRLDRFGPAGRARLSHRDSTLGNWFNLGRSSVYRNLVGGWGRKCDRCGIRRDVRRSSVQSSTLKRGRSGRSYQRRRLKWPRVHFTGRQLSNEYRAELCSAAAWEETE